MEFRVIVKDNHALTYKLLQKNDCLNVKININRANEIIVKSHTSMDFNYVDSVVMKYFDKLYKYISAHKEFAIYSIENNYMYIFGKKYELIFLLTNKRSTFEIHNDRIYVFIKSEEKKLFMIKKIYHEKANAFLLDRAKTLANLHDFVCTFETKWYIGRWGQCASKTKRITLADGLIGFDHKVIDYVIYHELCHLSIPNHSTKFWTLVAKYYPDYKWAQEKLKFQC